MPLFIDLHVDPNLTPEEVKQCHVADKKIQEKYGVRYLQILLNQPQGHLFCLVEGPDKETCARVHREAHGNVACNVLEITESDFSTLLSGRQKDGQDFTLNADGTVDAGVRAILTFHILGTPEDGETVHPVILDLLNRQGGKNTESLLSLSTFIFQSCTAAVNAGIEVLKKIGTDYPAVEIRMGISSGIPLGMEGNFFESTRKAAGWLAFISDKNAIALPLEVKNRYTGSLKPGAILKVLNSPEEKFLLQLSDYLEKSGLSPNLTVASMATEMGVSKSQLTRKLKLITALSPNDLIKEFRLRESIRLMHTQGMNVAEVTMAVGFSNPSYFTKCFRARFGQSPTRYLANK